MLTGAARQALESLESSGVSIPEAAREELENRTTESDAGEEERQCSCALTVYILYLGKPPTVPQIHEWDQAHKTLGGAAGGRIDITKFVSHIKLHSKTTDSAQTLERARSTQRSGLRTGRWKRCRLSPRLASPKHQCG